MAECEPKGLYAAETLDILTEADAVLEDDHFVYISGDHGSGWIDKDAIYLHTERIERLCRDMAKVVRELGAEVVCGPATGGLIIAEWTAHELGILSTFTEHEPAPEGPALRGRFVLRRGYDQIVCGKRVLIADDIVNTGLSLRQTGEAVCGAGGRVVGAACLVSRGNVAAAGLDVDRFVFLLEYKIPAWAASACPLCKSGVPINTRYAHGREFLARQGGDKLAMFSRKKHRRR
ncbi:MAG TPA: phosphoribosyltransferase family protein [Gemmataceae bacterium]|nr:phosphoribosyltransferase family protein [Gemmataceae bacterium]